MLVERASGYDLIGDTAGDIVLALGNDNIMQALTLWLRVRRGELAPLGWPDYGSRLHQLIGELIGIHGLQRVLVFKLGG